ncbi:MAG: hypothetical protein E7281_00060 [Lachnospiraceae bacterium]|nr:hypothetical protein [Lachnospiraceae bacterium]
MKKYKISLLIVSAILLTAFIFVELRDNNTDNYIYEKGLILSKESGFYDDAFLLEISAPTDEIYYTLDGSEPDRSSVRYSNPIMIDDATNNENTNSSRDDISAGYNDELIQEVNEKYKIYNDTLEEDERMSEEDIDRSISSPNYRIPDYCVDKCVVIKAVYYDNDVKSDVKTAVYFIGFEKKDTFNNGNVIVISMDSDDWFGYDNGIYVTGATFDNFLAADGIDFAKNPNSPYWWWWDANYRNKGSNCEREASVQIFSNGKNVINQQAGIRIQGGGSRGYAQKSLNIYSRDEYENGSFEYSFWEDGYYPKKMTLTACGDDWYSKIQDRIVADLSQDANLNVVTMNFRPYTLFLNGEFWGFYYLTEKYDANYLNYHYGVDKDSVVIVKNGLLEVGDEEDYDDYQEMMRFLSYEDMSDENNYKKACELFDMDSMIDYMAMELYVGRYGDWPAGNIQMWKTKSKGIGRYNDSRWRWMVFDQNSGGLTGMYTSRGNDVSCIDTLKYAREKAPWFDNLCRNDEFRKKLSAKIIDLGKNTFSAENVNSVIDEYVAEIELPMSATIKRFWGADDYNFRIEIESVRQFFNKRYDYMIQFLQDDFGIKEE